MAVQPTLKKAKEKKKPQISQLKGAKAKVMAKPKLAVSKPSVVAKTKAVAKSQSKPLSGGQRSMDVNKNNKLDAKDFAMLRNRKKRTKKRVGMSKPLRTA